MTVSNTFCICAKPVIGLQLQKQQVIYLPQTRNWMEDRGTVCFITLPRPAKLLWLYDMDTHTHKLYNIYMDQKANAEKDPRRSRQADLFHCTLYFTIIMHNKGAPRPEPSSLNRHHVVVLSQNLLSSFSSPDCAISIRARTARCCLLHAVCVF